MFLEDCRLRRLDPITMMANVIATNGKVPEELNRNVSREDKVSSPESETESA